MGTLGRVLTSRFLCYGHHSIHITETFPAMSRMKLLCVVLLGALASCSRQPATPQPQAAAVAAECPEPPAVAATGIQVLPPGVVLQVPMRLRAVTFQTRAGGRSRVRSVHEVLGGDSAATLQSVKQSMEGAGFRAGVAKDLANGRATTMGFALKGYGGVKVTIRNDVGPQPSDPDVSGLLVIDFPDSQRVEAPVAVPKT